MKTKICSIIIFTASMIVFTACKKDGFNGNSSESPANDVSLNVTVKKGEIYTLNLSSYGNGNASIIKQAITYSISQITRDISGNNIYQFSSNDGTKTNGVAAEEVVLKVDGLYRNEGNTGGCHNYQNNSGSYSSYEKKLTINFTVN